MIALRRDDIRKIWCTHARAAELGPLLSWAAERRIGYSVEEPAKLAKLVASPHHEGLVLAVRERPWRSFEDWLAELRAGATGGAPPRALLLEDVANPHNVGALLRAAAFFGWPAALFSPAARAALTPAALRVAEGGAERLALVRCPDPPAAARALAAAGVAVYGADLRGETPLADWAPVVPCVLAVGQEERGLSAALAAACRARVRIAGAVAEFPDSLNVAAAGAVLMAVPARGG